MTAIAWKNGTLATDSRETTGNGSILNEKSRKIYRHKHYVLAACGNSSTCAWFNAWLCSNFMISPQSHFDETSDAFLVDKKEKKLYVVYANGMKEELDAKEVHTSGSVHNILKVLLSSGRFNLSPAQAIKIIAKHNTDINDKVQQVKCW